MWLICAIHSYKHTMFQRNLTAKYLDTFSDGHIFWYNTTMTYVNAWVCLPRISFLQRVACRKRFRSWGTQHWMINSCVNLWLPKCHRTWLYLNDCFNIREHVWQREELHGKKWTAWRLIRFLLFDFEKVYPWT